MERVRYSSDGLGDSLFIKALNPNTDNKIQYDSKTVKYSTLLNNAVFIAAQVVNESLNKHIFDYEDIFKQDFFEERDKNSVSDEEYENGVLDFDSNDPTKFKDVETAQDETLAILHDIQDYLKKYCIDVIHKNKDIIKDIPVQQIYTLYNNGNCLPDKYKNLKQKVYKVIGKQDYYCLKNTINNFTKCFKLPLMNAYISKSVVDFVDNTHGIMLTSKKNKECRNKYIKLYKDYDTSLYNPIDFLLDNLDLMAEHLVGYCYIEINQINLVRKANQNQQGQPASSTNHNSNINKTNIRNEEENIFKNVKFHQQPKNNTDPIILVKNLVNDISNTLNESIANKKGLGQ